MLFCKTILSSKFVKSSTLVSVCLLLPNVRKLSRELDGVRFFRKGFPWGAREIKTMFCFKSLSSSPKKIMKIIAKQKRPLLHSLIHKIDKMDSFNVTNLFLALDREMVGFQGKIIIRKQPWNNDHHRFSNSFSVMIQEK